MTIDEIIKNYSSDSRIESYSVYQLELYELDIIGSLGYYIEDFQKNDQAVIRRIVKYVY